MKIPSTEWLKEKYKINYLYHITHVDNLLNISKYGLLSHRRAHAAHVVLEDIADEVVIDIRKTKRVPISRRQLTEYVPLFFTPLTPMLYRRKNIQDDIAVLCLDRNLLFQRGVIFTDGNAASNDTTFFGHLTDLAMLDWDCIRSRTPWTDYTDGRRKRSAEVLVPDWVPFADVQRIITRTSATEQNLHSKLRSKAEVQPRWYFDN